MSSMRAVLVWNKENLNNREGQNNSTSVVQKKLIGLLQALEVIQISIIEVPYKWV